MINFSDVILANQKKKIQTFRSTKNFAQRNRSIEHGHLVVYHPSILQHLSRRQGISCRWKWTASQRQSTKLTLNVDLSLKNESFIKSTYSLLKYKPVISWYFKQCEMHYAYLGLSSRLNTIIHKRKLYGET